MKRTMLIVGAIAGLFVAVPAAAQVGGRLTVEPYIGYGFFGGIPDQDVRLEADLAFGGRVGYALTPQWSAFGNFQRSTPTLAAENDDQEFGEVTVDHWSVGVEFAYVPRGGAEGMLPILLEAGLGQARYDPGESDFAVNIGLASAFQLADRFTIRYGANDYISNYAGDGVVNQIFVRIGAELRL